MNLPQFRPDPIAVGATVKDRANGRLWKVMEHRGQRSLCVPVQPDGKTLTPMGRWREIKVTDLRPWKP